MAPVGEGNLDGDRLIPVCEAAGTKWYAVEQDVCHREASGSRPLPSILVLASGSLKTKPRTPHFPAFRRLQLRLPPAPRNV